MALSQKHRNVLFDFLSPRVGEETAEALMAEFPAAEGKELVTKEFLRAELAELRTEVHDEIGSLRADTAALKSDLTVRMISAIAVATAVIVAFGR
jgi:hypothetical protein